MTFLNGDLEEEIYMEQPEGFVVPDIACAISELSRYTSNPGQSHWIAMKRVLGYLEHTQDFALHYNIYLVMIEGYCDANWITGSTDFKFTNGYVFIIGGGAVFWKSSKQTCIAHSTMESEFITLDKVGEEVEWLRNFLEDIPFWPKPIELLIDPGTWDPMDEDMVSLDPIEFHSEEEPYKDRIDSYQRKTGLTEAVQTGIGQLNGIPVAIGVMDFQFMGGSMGSVVGEKITRLIEYAANQILPLIIVCASGGARMQEGSLSLMQMAKISSALYDYQLNKKLFYVSILTSPTTGGVTASFGMLGDIIIAEPNAYIAFAGKRVIEQTLNKTVPEGSQAAEYLFQKGLFDLIVPRNLLKSVLSELFKLHAFFPLNQKSSKIK
ncbi:acetyl-coenzyme A carboxylase carboxyl transferase subunit beta, chloroplastic-like [Nicotiana sylvestris]|uniref:acetyl-coenzyme A carboxylase carboxyl transferase subunit beta, chloroplastic-like n=1 Tax=Nicotiana sylvestris TaxID=4096 RepID=UPI00388C6386